MLLHSPAGESSPTSPDNFRQLDDVFLQTQTRIWLGEVLRTRLNEQRTIADLLADGELLFEVSKEIWKMIPSKRSELKAYDYEPFAFRNSGRYMPYSFVDSFLKMCKILGLDGIDLFSPSDVVEKGDTRKVCMCLRALSKKTRSLHLNVPDFDIVMHTIAMPTDMVGYIRRSWEPSLSEYSSSSSLAQLPKSRQRSSQEHLNELCGRNYSSVKEFGDSETNSTLQPDSTSINYLYNSSSDIGTNSVIKAKKDCSDLSSVHLGVETQEMDESSHCQQAEVSSINFGGSFFLHQLDNNQEENAASRSVVDSNSESGGSFVNVESGSGNSYKNNLVEQIYHNLNLEDKASVVGDFLRCSQQAAIIGDSSILDDNSSILNACVETSPCCSKKMSDKNEYSNRSLNGDDVEMSSVGSVNSMSIYVRNLDFEDDLEIQESFPKLDEMSMKVTEGFKSQDIIGHGTLEQILSTNEEEESPKLKGVDIGLSMPKCCIACSDKYDKNNSMSGTNLNAGDEGKESFAVEYCFSHGVSQWDQKGKCQTAVVPPGNVGCDDALSQSPSLIDSYEQTTGCTENPTDSSHEDFNISCNIVENGTMNKNEETIQKLKIPELEKTDDHTTEIAKSKPPKRPLLKAFVSGTAVVGATLLLLHFRKNGREKSAELGKQSNGVRSTNGRNLSSGKAQKARKEDGVYPAGKLKL